MKASLLKIPGESLTSTRFAYHYSLRFQLTVPQLYPERDKKYSTTGVTSQSYCDPHCELQSKNHASSYLKVPQDPAEGFILNYTLLIGDMSFSNFQKVRSFFSYERD